MTRRLFINTQSLLLLISLIILSSSFYFQYFKGLEPCPLCLMQRGCTFFLTMLGLAGVVLSTMRRARIIVIAQLFFSLAGLFFASRQIWLQSFTSTQPPACMPSLDIMMRYFPWQDVAHVLFFGEGNCAEVQWSWLGLSMPAWSAIYFVTIAAATIIIFWRLQSSLAKHLK